MRITENLGLNLPEVDDFYDIEHQNENMQIIDEEMSTLKKSVSDGKSAVASAITGMGVSTESDATFDEMATNPVRGSRHLLAEHFQRYFLGTFND